MADDVSDRATRFLGQRWVLCVVVVILAIYSLEAHARAHKNSSPADLGDQGAYLGYARHLYESNYTVTEDRNRMPIYPFLLSLIYRPGMSESEFLVSAQRFTVNLSILLLALLFLVFRRFFPPLSAVALLAATAFGVFLYRAGKAQTEPLFYFLSFCSFVLLLRVFQRPRWWLAVLAGATTGLAHLTKASVLPALVIWAAVFGGQIVWNWRTAPGRRAGLLALVVVLVSFLAVVFPYIQTSKRIYGAYFYNVNSTFVMWCDSSDEAFQFLGAYDKAEWRVLPAEQLPSFRKYWREHSVAQIMRRVQHGSRRLATQNARLIGYYKFVIALLAIAAILIVRRRQQACEVLGRNPFAAIFCLLVFAAYFLLYAWYDAIVNDTRFVLSIFLPFVFAASLLVLRLGQDRLSLAGRQFSFERFFGGLFLALSVIDVLYAASDFVQ